MPVLLYLGIFSLMLPLLFINVVRFRFKTKTSLGDGGHEELIKARAMHSNFVETVPFILLLLVAFEMLQIAPWVSHIFGVAMIISRIFHINGVLEYIKFPVPSRAIGSVTFLLLMIAGGLILLFHYFQAG